MLCQIEVASPCCGGKDRWRRGKSDINKSQGFQDSSKYSGIFYCSICRGGQKVSLFKQAENLKRWNVNSGKDCAEDGGESVGKDTGAVSHHHPPSPHQYSYNRPHQHQSFSAYLNMCFLGF